MQKLLWTPSEEQKNGCRMADFMRYVNRRFGKDFHEYAELYQWSVAEIPDFWAAIWDYFDVICSKPYDKVVDDLNKFPGARWFEGAKLNYAENILRFCDRDGVAITFRGEDYLRTELTRRELKTTVERLATAFRNEGVKPGDTIAGYLPNLPETVIAMLAAAAVGATWCSCATDIGAGAAVDRVGQIHPVILVTTDGYRYKGKTFSTLPNVKEIAAGIPSLRRVVVVHYAGEPELSDIPMAVRFEDYLAPAPADFAYEQVPASHPLVVMFSSGTTGKPKCMVQSHAGILVNQLKELTLHCNIQEGSKLLYITTCSWMMWNWQAAALGTGAELCLFEGNPSYPDDAAIWKVLEEEKVTDFGLSASYIHMLIAHDFKPREHADLSALRAISQTGSALSDAGWEFVYSEIKKDYHFNSIAGGTDINGCFGIGNMMIPVYSGELSGLGLGEKVECYDDAGKPIRDREGELVCEKPIPSMPLCFWDDPKGERYFNAYFTVYPGIWRHGDYVILHGNTGGLTFCGRSDSILKPSGVRIGTAEIYNQVNSLSEVEDSLAVGQNINGDQRIVLFVKCRPGYALDDALIKKIKTTLRTKASPRHVPAVILETPEIPTTLNGKKVEGAVTNILNGRPVGNRDALSNPESLKFYEDVLPQLQS
ncbi:MAG: acetoacetate--CoA ligase [Ruminococcaceae bacterium]|jgi:acetoacetyl-CoA synthetase|nr:acetoacetate--CoA ligase [Oscillospiraceae bacterium]